MWHVHCSWWFRYVFHSDDNDINNRIFFISIFETVIFKHRSFKWFQNLNMANCQLDPKCQTQTHICLCPTALQQEQHHWCCVSFISPDCSITHIRLTFILFMVDFKTLNKLFIRFIDEPQLLFKLWCNSFIILKNMTFSRLLTSTFV